MGGWGGGVWDGKIRTLEDSAAGVYGLRKR